MAITEAEYLFAHEFNISLVTWSLCLFIWKWHILTKRKKRISVLPLHHNKVLTQTLASGRAFHFVVQWFNTIHPSLLFFSLGTHRQADWFLPPGFEFANLNMRPSLKIIDWRNDEGMPLGWLLSCGVTVHVWCNRVTWTVTYIYIDILYYISIQNLSYILLPDWEDLLTHCVHCVSVRFTFQSFSIFISSMVATIN